MDGTPSKSFLEKNYPDGTRSSPPRLRSPESRVRSPECVVRSAHYRVPSAQSWSAESWSAECQGQSLRAGAPISDSGSLRDGPGMPQDAPGSIWAGSGEFGSNLAPNRSWGLLAEAEVLSTARVVPSAHYRVRSAHSTDRASSVVRSPESVVRYGFIARAKSEKVYPQKFPGTPTSIQRVHQKYASKFVVNPCRKRSYVDFGWVKKQKYSGKISARSRADARSCA